MANIILNKGGAGISVSRKEAVERLEPISRELSRLNLYYLAAANRASHEEISEEINRHLRKSYIDVGKIAETVLSCGGVPYNATDLEPENFVLEGSDAEMLEALRDKEEEFQRLVKAESDVRHQIRTQAILLNVETSSQERLNYVTSTLRTLGQKV